MFSWLHSHPEAVVPVQEAYTSVIDGIKKIYRNRIRPVEEMYKFGDFHSPMMTDADFDARPMVLLLGQYSTGKTSFIRFLLERDFPGQNIGPEPTTDRFIAVMHGKEDKIIPGNALCVQARGCPHAAHGPRPAPRRRPLPLPH